MIKKFTKAAFLVSFLGVACFVNAQEYNSTVNPSKQGDNTYNWNQSRPKYTIPVSKNPSFHPPGGSYGDLFGNGLVQNSVKPWTPTDTDFCYLNYIENKGQWYNKVIYQSDFHGGRVFLEKNGLAYVFYPPGGFERFHPHPGKIDTADFNHCTLTFQAIKMQFVNSTSPIIHPAEQRDFYNNYYLGNDPKHWTSKCNTYGKVYYSNL